MANQPDNRSNKSKDQTSPADVKLGKSVNNVLGGGFMNRSGFVKWLPYIVFVAMLAIFYIANIYVAESKKREIENLTKELKEVRYNYLNTKSELMYLSKQSQLVDRLKSKGIRESLTPPKKLVMEKEK